MRLRDNVYVGEGSLAENIEQIQGPAVIGNYCAIDETASIGRYTVLGNNVIVKEFCETEYCVVDANTYLGPRSQVRGAVIGKNCEVRAHASIAEGAVIGDECSIGEQSTIAPHVRIYPVQAGRDRRARPALADLAAARRVDALHATRASPGIVNVDITPETATRLAMAYGTALQARRAGGREP